MWSREKDDADVLIVRVTFGWTLFPMKSRKKQLQRSDKRRHVFKDWKAKNMAWGPGSKSNFVTRKANKTKKTCRSDIKRNLQLTFNLDSLASYVRIQEVFFLILSQFLPSRGLWQNHSAVNFNYQSSRGFIRLIKGSKVSYNPNISHL